VRPRDQLSATRGEELLRRLQTGDQRLRERGTAGRTLKMHAHGMQVPRDRSIEGCLLQQLHSSAPLHGAMTVRARRRRNYRDEQRDHERRDETHGAMVSPEQAARVGESRDSLRAFRAVTPHCELRAASRRLR
jgi:hypothetical protein